MRRSKKTVFAAVALGLMTGLVAASPTRTVFKRLIARVAPSLAIGSEPTITRLPQVQTPAGTDVEQRARTAHGWSSAISNSVAQGSIIYYDINGRASAQYSITISRAYPDRVRVDINRGGVVEAFGFDQVIAWRRGAPILTASQLRDIRSFARLCPERLFVSRAAGL